MPVVRVTWFEGKETATKQAVAADILVMAHHLSISIFPVVKISLN